MEENRSEIQDRVEKSGATEQEAHVLYHLDEVGRLLHELPGMTETDLKTCAQHVTALTHVLASRVAERDHPEGWFFSEGHVNR